MRHRSTPPAVGIGAATLLCAAVAVAAAIVRYPFDAPRYDAGAQRWDVLVPLALAAVLARGWVAAVKAAPAYDTLPAVAARTGIPARLGPVRRDWGRIAATYLVVWAPYAVARSAYGTGGSRLGVALCAVTFVYGLVPSLYGIGLLTRQLEAPHRLLRKDAAAGRVLALRVRVGTPVRQDYRTPARKGTGKVDTHTTYAIDLVPDTGPAGRVRFGPMQGANFRTNGERHLAHAAARLGGHTGWLCWPTLWKEIAATDRRRTVPAALVTDSGHVVWGETYEEDWGPWLRGGDVPLQATEAAARARPLARPSRYTPGVHSRALVLLLVAALVAAPALLGVGPGVVAVLLGAVAEGLIVFTSVRLAWPDTSREIMRPDLWKLRTESHPSLR
ncbi:hypothetical protein [Streptomyces sp. NPDC003697]